MKNKHSPIEKYQRRFGSLRSERANSNRKQKVLEEKKVPVCSGLICLDTHSPVGRIQGREIDDAKGYGKTDNSWRDYLEHAFMVISFNRINTLHQSPKRIPEN